MAIRDLKAVVYTDDSGKNWATAISADVFAQASGALVGGADYTGDPALDPLPRGLIPRSVTVSNAGNKRRVVCLTSSGTLYTGAATTVDLYQIGAAAAVTYTRYKSNRERDHRPFRDPSG